MFGHGSGRKVAAALLGPVVAAAVLIAGSPAVALGAVPLPVVVSFKASKTSIPNSSSTITFTATLKYAHTCKLSVTPAMKGLPKSFTCGTSTSVESHVSEKVTIPTNATGSPINYSFALGVTDNAGTTQATNVAVTQGAAPPPISFTTPSPGTPKTAQFGSEGVFVADEPLEIQVTNNSATATQLISGLGVMSVGDANDFTETGTNCGYISPNESCSFDVQFRPTGAGPRTGEFSVTDASWGPSGTSATLGLSGTGIWGVATLSNPNISSNTLTFPGTQGLYTSSTPQTVIVTNASSLVPLSIGLIGITGGEASNFVIPNGGSCEGTVISIGQSCTFQVMFVPNGTGARTSYITIGDNTLGDSTELAVAGTSGNASVTLAENSGTAQSSPLTVNFGSTTSALTGGTGVHADVTLVNTSDEVYDITSDTWTGINGNTGDFNVSVIGNCPAAGDQLPPAGQCTFQLNFLPQNTGTRSATLTLYDNTSGGFETINVTGVGT